MFVGTNNQEVPTSFYTSTRYTIWDSGCTHYINPYFEIYTQYKPLEKGYDAEVNGIGGLINTKGIGTFTLELEYDTGKIHNIIKKNVYYFPGAPKLLISPQKLSWDRGEYEAGREETYLNLMGKLSVLVWNNRKPQRTILHAP